MLWALVQFLIIARIPVRSEGITDSTGLVGSNDEATTRRLNEIYTAIYEGAESFLRAEYKVCAWFCLFFSIVIFILVSWGTGWDFARGLFTTLSFILGAGTSIREYFSCSREFHCTPNPLLTLERIAVESP
jgi:Na+/H+-translocating membrane pyrophosphatase